MKVYSYEGKNKEDAIAKMLYDLNIEDESELFLKTSSTEEGLFKSKKEKIEVLVKDEVIEYLKKTLTDVVNQMGLEVNFECQKRENYIKINLFSNNNAILIGKNGKTMASLQNILRHAILNNTGFYINIILDVEDYKEKYNRRLVNEALRKAKEVENKKISISLLPMNSYERRLIHEAVANMKVETISEGEEPNRYIVINPKE